MGRSLGLGGRSRRAGSIAERARLNVTRALRSSLRRIAAADGALGSHLEITVHTGTVCLYSPDPVAGRLAGIGRGTFLGVDQRGTNGLVGGDGIEPPTSAMSTQRSSHLS